MTLAPSRPLTIALIGNPNTGKSTLFNALAGLKQRVGNYPGVTVEKKEGRAQLGERSCTLIDLPGTYSLAPRSPDEMITVDVLLGRRDDTPAPDAILCIVDASNLERNLYLVSQALELGRPTVVALNMIDLAKSRGLSIDVAELSRRLKLPVIAVQANKKLGLAELREALAAAAERQAAATESPFPAEFQREVSQLTQFAAEHGQRSPPRYLLERLLLDQGGYLEQSRFCEDSPGLLDQVIAARRRLAEAGYPAPAVEAISRYEWVAQMLEGVVERPSVRPRTWTDRIDRVLTHRVWGVVFFVLLMFAMFVALFRYGKAGSDLLAGVFDTAGQAVGGWLGEGPLQSLVQFGVMGGVGAVLTFLPQIFILFFFIAVLEDCGYMARAAYLMDKLMARVGLSGKSFIPLLSSFACAIPGIMAARVIENRRDRLITMLVAPLMSCAARLPVYTLMVTAIIPPLWLGGWLSLQALVMTAAYFVGIIAAVAVAGLLKKTILPGPTPPFVMELPSYKFPSAGTVFFRMWERGWAYIVRAGSLIFAVSVLIWAAGYYPHHLSAEYRPLTAKLADLDRELDRLAPPTELAGESEPDSPEVAAMREERNDLANRIAGGYRRNSFLGRAGRAIEPAVRPLGWDWRIGCAVIASFPAREVVVSSMGVIYNLGKDVKSDDPSLAGALARATWDDSDPPRKVFTVPAALSLMVFFALCAQCASTLVILRRETNSWEWPAFTFVYMTSLAYVAALVTYQGGTWLSLWMGAGR